MGLFGFGGKKPARQRPGNVVGHGGIAAGDLTNPDLSAGNVERWRNLSGDEVSGFVYEGELLFVHSTNVSAAQYHHAARSLMVEYKDGSAYLYSDVSEAEAIDFAKAGSKGGWVWDNLRVRGSKTQHKKKFTQLR